MLLINFIVTVMVMADAVAAAVMLIQDTYGVLIFFLQLYLFYVLLWWQGG